MSDGVISRRDISHGLARRLIDGAIAEAERIGVSMAISVVDRGLHLVAAARMDGTPLGAMDLAFGKAHTAAAWGAPSGEFFQSTQPGGADWAFTTTGPHVVVYAGGLPILHEGETIGAIGASGGTAEQDEWCVAAALRACGL